jgi:hypothetical protein
MVSGSIFLYLLIVGCGKEALEEPSGVPEAWREREGRELFSSDAVTATTAKEVATTERSGNAEALLHITILLSEALANGTLLNANANGMTCLPQVQGRDVCIDVTLRLRTLSRA